MFHSILWPIDGSPLAASPLSRVLDLASLSGAAVVLLSVAEPRLYRGADADAIETGQVAEGSRLAQATAQVAQVYAALQEAGVACSTQVTMGSVPGAAIAEAAGTLGCDLIVMASRGKMGMLDTLLSESTTQDVLMAARVPVLVCPHPG